MPAAFDERETLDETTRCLYRIDLAGVPSADAARRASIEMLARVHHGRRLRPDAEHVLAAQSPEGVPADVRATLFTPWMEAFDAVDVTAPPSWLDDDARLLPERAASAEASWNRIASAFESGASLTAVVAGVDEGALRVDVGVPGRLPVDQVDLRPVRDPSVLLERRLEVRVIRFRRDTGDLVVSRRVILEERRDARRHETWPTLREGAVLRGTVRALTAYGAFVDLGGVTALLHASRMGALVPLAPPVAFALGEELEVSVTKFVPETERIDLALHGPTERR